MRNDDHLERKDLRIGLGMFHVGADMFLAAQMWTKWSDGNLFRALEA